MENIPRYIFIKEAARLLNVSQPRLRRWDNSGKLVAKRHPISGYRIYNLKDITELRNKLLGLCL